MTRRCLTVVGCHGLRRLVLAALVAAACVLVMAGCATAREPECEPVVVIIIVPQ